MNPLVGGLEGIPSANAPGHPASKRSLQEGEILQGLTPPYPVQLKLYGRHRPCGREGGCRPGSFYQEGCGVSAFALRGPVPQVPFVRQC